MAGPAFSGESRGKSTRGLCPLDPHSGEEVPPPRPPSLVSGNLRGSRSSGDNWPAALSAIGSKRAAHRLGGWGQIHYPSGVPQIHNLWAGVLSYGPVTIRGCNNRKNRKRKITHRFRKNSRKISFLFLFVVSIIRKAKRTRSEYLDEQPTIETFYRFGR